MPKRVSRPLQPRAERRRPERQALSLRTAAPEDLGVGEREKMGEISQGVPEERCLLFQFLSCASLVGKVRSTPAAGGKTHGGRAARAGGRRPSP